MIRAILLTLGLLAATQADAGQVLRNSTFTSWSHGSPVRGAFGSGRETATGWVSKWGKSEASVAVASRAPGGGYRYALRPDPKIKGGDGPYGGETFYLRQYVKRPAPGNYQATITVRSLSPRVRGGFYIYQGDHLHTLNQVAGFALPAKKWRTFTTPYRLPKGLRADLASAFLFTTPRAATVDIRSFRMFTVP